MNLLNDSGLKETLDDLVLKDKIPVLGICVGMQILARKSHEGEMSGLGWVDAEVKKFVPSSIKYKTKQPHMGWNTIIPQNNNLLLDGFNSGARFYFLHSYYVYCQNIDNEIAKTEYGISFTSVVNNKNIYGVQFHPEKSHQNGIHLLNNFANL